ncbi:MAG: clostripain-related cysteine peptidase, partial [Thermoplasmata archaeon]
MEHRRKELLVSLLMATIILVPVCVAAAPQGKKAAQEKEWNLLMFWDADNNLEFCTEFAMQTWEAALTSSKYVNIVAYIDIISVDGVWIYDIVDGKRRMVAEWPEMDSSDPATLERFLEFALKSYPAKKNMLVLQDHGFGWRGVCNDETNRDTLMTIDGVARAVRDAEKATRKAIDLLAMDACNMATIEVAYELRDVVPYFVASETMVPYDGLPYMMFISDLMADPKLGPVQLAESIVYEYVEYYSSKWDYEHIYTYSQDFATMAAIDMSRMGALGEAFQNLATTLRPLIKDHRTEV